MIRCKNVNITYSDKILMISILKITKSPYHECCHGKAKRDDICKMSVYKMGRPNKPN